MADSDDGVSAEFWAVAHLKFPEGAVRDEARRAVALNFCTNMETGLNKDWEKQFDAVLAKLRGLDSAVVKPFKPKVVPDDNTG